MFKKTAFIVLLYMVSAISSAKPTIDREVYRALQDTSVHSPIMSLMVFFNSLNAANQFKSAIPPSAEIHETVLNFMPVVIVTYPKKIPLFDKIVAVPTVVYIALNKPAGEKIEIGPHATKPKVPFRYPGIDLWWENGYKGQSGVIGLIDSGIAPDHPALAAKNVIINKSQLSKYMHGVRSAHGTGVACIYAGYPRNKKQRVRGFAYKAPVILSTLAGEGSDNSEDFWLTYSSLNWLLSESKIIPSVINYSFGNGDITCKDCPDWSGMSKVVDYVVNQKKILWVTSAGNNGYIKQKRIYPFASTMTIPADSYNALTVANMNMYASEDETSSRRFSRFTHAIRYTSSRGPTLIGRKKPDITAPGNDTYTCAPDPIKYGIKYSTEMNYEDGYRLMGGTSSAAPHVGGAILLLKEAGIHNPMAIKALLINSADTWTDSNKPGPHDPEHHYRGGHHRVGGSEWNPTYGWGYLNMQNAFYQRKQIIADHLTLDKPEVEYRMKISNKDKITLVHERRVGFNAHNKPWKFSHLKLEMYDYKSGRFLAGDQSAIDNVHQISLCNAQNLRYCFLPTSREVLIRVSLVSPKLEGSGQEDFALAGGTLVG